MGETATTTATTPRVDDVAGDSVTTMLDASIRTVPASMCLRDAARALAADGIGLLVVERPGGGMIGVASERDLVRAVADDVDLESERLDEVMSVDVLTIPTDATVAQATAEMVEAEVRHLVVVDEGSRVAGVVSARDVLLAWHGLAPG